jgi:DNA-binding transcriptional LysR family regulator
MDLNDAAVFVKVVSSGSFSAASRLLGLPISTVSTRVARLEKNLCITLLQRTTRKLHLTEAGELYFHHASTGLEHLLDAEAAVTQSLGTPKGLLHVTAPADLGNHLLAEIMGQMHRTYPQIRIEMVLMSRYMDLVAEGIDVAIRTGPLKDSTLIAKNVGIARWKAYASPTYLETAPSLVSPSELRHHSCLQFVPLGKDAWTLKTENESLTIPMVGQTMINDVRVIHSLTLSGEGVALLPTYLCKDDCATGRLVHVLPGWQAKADPVHIVYPRQRFMPSHLRAFIDLAAQILHNRLEQI